MSREYISICYLGTISMAAVHTICSTHLTFYDSADRLLWSVMYFIWLPTDFVPRKRGFNSRSINVVFCTDEGAVEHFSPARYHSSSARYSCN